jgi:hypothetical protein
MTTHSRKGYRAIKVRDSKSGQIVNAAVKIGSGLDRRVERQRRKAEKAQREQRRQFKAAQREAKKVVPLHIRARVNWSASFKPQEADV